MLNFILIYYLLHIYDDTEYIRLSFPLLKVPLYEAWHKLLLI